MIYTLPYTCPSDKGIIVIDEYDFLLKLINIHGDVVICCIVVLIMQDYLNNFEANGYNNMHFIAEMSVKVSSSRVINIST